MKEIFNWAKIIKDDDQPSYQKIYVPTFKNYCIGIETVGRINVSIKHQSKLVSKFFIEN
jgi:hypothetical protein